MSVVSAIALSSLLGGGLAAGVLLLLAAAPRWGAASLSVRIAPYVRDVIVDRDLPRGTLPRVGTMPVAPRSLWARAAALFARAIGTGESLRRRLSQAGSALDPVAFRARQLAWMIAALGGGAMLAIVLAVAGRSSPAAAVLPFIAVLSAAVVVDTMLTVRANARRTRLSEELPTTLEFLALCLSAGEGFLDALRRVAAAGSGELAAEFRRVVLAVGTGSALADALVEMADRLRLAGLSRAVSQIGAALEHGAPLAAVLHAQAGDAREESRRLLIEQAGRKEILMLLPLVFLILPLSVLFAIYPGLFILRLGVG